jgi:hypothetical protein
LFYIDVKVRKDVPTCRITTTWRGRTNIFLCELNALDMGILVMFARSSRRLNIFREVHISLPVRSFWDSICWVGARHWERFVAVRLQELERRGNADPVELVKDLLDERRHGVDIDQLSLAQTKRPWRSSPCHAPRVEGGGGESFAGGNWIAFCGGEKVLGLTRATAPLAGQNQIFGTTEG